MTQEKSPPINYAFISLCQFIFAILVIILHAQRIFPADSWHFVQKSIFSRMAVPFFLISATFFLRHKQAQHQQATQTYFKRLTHTYLFWSFFYLPYAISYFFTLDLPIYTLPLVLLIALLYTGMCYQLWYLPALLTGFRIYHFLKKKLRFKWLFCIALSLYLLGMTETYTAYLEGTQWLQIYEAYRAIFFTTRNGLFYVPIFICLGHLAYEYRHHPWLSQATFKKLCFSLLLWGIEGYFIFIRQGVDKNFFFSLLPVSLFFFNWVSRTSIFLDKNWQHLKALSVYYYFLHPIFIELGFAIVKSSAWPLWQKGGFVASFTILCTHLLSQLLLDYKQAR